MLHKKWCQCLKTKKLTLSGKSILSTSWGINGSGTKSKILFILRIMQGFKLVAKNPNGYRAQSPKAMGSNLHGFSPERRTIANSVPLQVTASS